MATWLALLIGAFVGGVCSLIVFAALAVGAQADERMRVLAAQIDPPVGKARGHANISWWCRGCGKRNRASIRLNSDPTVLPCAHCQDGAADVIPPSVDAYCGSMGESLREESAS